MNMLIWFCGSVSSLVSSYDQRLTCLPPLIMFILTFDVSDFIISCFVLLVQQRCNLAQLYLPTKPPAKLAIVVNMLPPTLIGKVSENLIYHLPTSAFQDSAMTTSCINVAIFQLQVHHESQHPSHSSMIPSFSPSHRQVMISYQIFTCSRPIYMPLRPN